MSGLIGPGALSNINLNKLEITNGNKKIQITTIDIQEAVKDSNEKYNISEYHSSTHSAKAQAGNLFFVEGLEYTKDDSLKEKYSNVLGVDLKNKSSIPYVHKIELEKGQCEIKYRFKADTEKSTFSNITTSPKEYGKNKEFFYVNGINTKKNESQKTANELSKLSGQNIKPIYNPTEGMFSDLLEAASERFSDKKFDKISKEAASNFYNTLSSGKNLKIIAHSQGAAITSDALKLCQKMLSLDKSSEIKKANPNLTKYQVDFESARQVKKIMSGVEVITMGGAASQDKFPGVKLVEVINPKDPVPKIAGTDKIEVSMARNVVTSGKVSYVANSKSVTSALSNGALINPNIQHVLSGVFNLPNTVLDGVSFGTSGKNIIDFHKIDDGKDAYINQTNVRSLIYNFGRQDFQMIQ